MKLNHLLVMNASRLRAGRRNVTSDEIHWSGFPCMCLFDERLHFCRLIAARHMTFHTYGTPCMYLLTLDIYLLIGVLAVEEGSSTAAGRSHKLNMGL
jgi:hypothetical protein